MKHRQKAFALPTVLVSSVIMLMVLVAAVSITIALRTSLDEGRYNRLAEMAAEAGTSYAQACIEANSGTVTWTNVKPLKPETDCNGDVVVGRLAYVLQRSDFQTSFSVPRPVLGAGNEPLVVSATGKVELRRKSNGSIIWKTFNSTDTVALGGQTDATPVGGSIEGYWTSAPQGYLLEDGSAVSRTTYADLFNVIGTKFGAGNGSTTFNLPDSRGRVTVARSNDAEFSTIGNQSGTGIGGEKSHTLTESEMAVHDHDFAGVTIFWGSAGDVFFRLDNDTNDRIQAVAGTSPAGAVYTDQNANGWTDTYNVGGGGAHNEIQPYIVALRVIKF